MADYFGWDIGGVHLKLARLACGGGAISIRTRTVPFEIWKEPGGLAPRLRSLLEEVAADPGARPAAGAPRGTAAAHAVTMTAELSDVFPSRMEGVRAVLRACAEALPAPPRVLDLGGRLVGMRDAMERPLDVAAANWMATARLAARAVRDGLLVDVGSTTTDIIPLRDGEPCPAGRADTERLLSGELVYTGFLRTPPSSLTDTVPVGGEACRVCPEHFTIMGDVHRVLDRIEEADYTVPTPDGRGRTREECLARLARLVCADLAAIGPRAVETIARFLEERQIGRIAAAIAQVLARRPEIGRAPVVVAGAGAFLARAAAGRLGRETARLSALLPRLAGEAWDREAPSAALAVLLAEESGEPRFIP